VLPPPPAPAGGAFLPPPPGAAAGLVMFAAFPPGGPAPAAPAAPAPAPRLRPGLSLLDDQGEVLEQTVVRTSARRDARGFVLDYTLTVQPAAGREASKLVYTASRSAVVEIPFTLKDVPLP
jgi:hypothetical protein